jgi:hypothetical protein
MYHTYNDPAERAKLMMPEPYTYARQKLWEAVNVLVGDLPMKKRLGYARGLLLLLEPEKDLPEHLRSRFQALVEDLNKRVVHWDFRPSWVVSRHPKSGRMAEEILSLYTELRGGI